jgi:CheY-like chemotaxis protein/nitrogen-specific signal transduction histidine kinase
MRTAELQEANEQLKEMDRLKSKFVAHVSHELRTPLTSINGFIDNMLSGVAGSLTEKQNQYLMRMKVNGERLGRMIADVLDRTRIEAKKIHLFLGEVLVTTLAREIVEQLRPLAQARGQRLELICMEPTITIWADPDKVSQILTNLVDNAIKYTPEGGSITVRVTQDGPHFAEVSVKDTGEGIPSEALPKLFDPFFRTSSHEKSAIKGLGLGLSIVKDLIELHGGHISVESSVGLGSTFTFTLPLRHVLEKVSVPDNASEKRLLVVDDDPDIRQLLHDRLTADHFAVQTATDGEQALEMMRQITFDGLILDINMPNINGLEVLHRIRESVPAMPVIMITAADARERALLAMEAGAQAYLLKPLDAAQFRLAVNRWFGSPT